MDIDAESVRREKAFERCVEEIVQAHAFAREYSVKNEKRRIKRCAFQVSKKPELLNLGLFEPHMSVCFGIIFFETKFVGGILTILGGRIEITGTGFGNETNFFANSCHQ